MIRHRPLEVEEAVIGDRCQPSRNSLTLPALSDRIGIEPASRVLGEMDDFYAEMNGRPEVVATQVARQFADPAPRDRSVTKRLDSYKRLDAPRHLWGNVVETLRSVAVAMVRDTPEAGR